MALGLHYAIELSTNLFCYLHRNPPHLISHPEPSRTSSAICTRTLQNLIGHQSAPEPSGTSSSAFCPGTLRNLISHLHRNPPEPHQPSAPEPSGTSSAICPETSSAICTGTLRNLLRNLVLQLHRIAPELFWAKDPKFCCWGKIIRNIG